MYKSFDVCKLSCEWTVNCTVKCYYWLCGELVSWPHNILAAKIASVQLWIKKKGDNKKIKDLVFENIQKQLIFCMEIYVLHTISYQMCIYCRSYRAVAEHNVCYSVCMYLPYTVDCLRTCFCYRPESSVFVNCVSHSTFKRNFVAYIKW